MFLTPIDTTPGGPDGRWAYVGDPDWRTGEDGIVYPPVFADPRFDRGADQVPDLYAHPLAREDYAILADLPLEDADVAFESFSPCTCTVNGPFRTTSTTHSPIDRPPQLRGGPTRFQSCRVNTTVEACFVPM